MPLSLTTSTGSGQIEGYMGESIFIDEAEIIEIFDRSGSKKTERQSWTNDLQVEVKVRLTKNDWERTFNIGGNFTKDPTTNEVLDWGATFKVRNLFEACNALQADALGSQEELDNTVSSLEKGDINPVLSGFCVGKTIKILSYRKEDGKSKTWNQVAHVKRDNQKWKDYFLKQVDKGYVKDYAPDAKSTKPTAPTASKANGALDMTWENNDSESKLDEF